MARTRNDSSDSRRRAVTLMRTLTGGVMALSVAGALWVGAPPSRVSAVEPSWSGPCFPVMLTVTSAGGGDPQPPGPVTSPSCPRMNHGSGGGDVYVPLNPTPVAPAQR